MYKDPLTGLFRLIVFTSEVLIFVRHGSARPYEMLGSECIDLPHKCLVTSIMCKVSAPIYSSCPSLYPAAITSIQSDLNRIDYNTMPVILKSDLLWDGVMYWWPIFPSSSDSRLTFLPGISWQAGVYEAFKRFWSNRSFTWPTTMLDRPAFLPLAPNFWRESIHNSGRLYIYWAGVG